MDWLLTRQKGSAKWWDVLCAFFITMVLTVCLLTKSREHGRLLAINPFTGLDMLLKGEIHTGRQVGSNVLLYIPVGFVLNLRISKTKTICCGFIFSVAIEAVQYLLAIGSSELLDVIANLAGTGIGVFILRVIIQLRKCFKKDQNRA